MKFINTDGMAFIGPGSEWFWTAISGIVLAVTFLAIYRQLALARGANAFSQLGALVEEWEGERLVRKRIAIMVALRDGAAAVDIPEAPADAVANYWEKVGALVRAGHIPASLIAESMGFAHDWWGMLAPYVLKWRTEVANPDLWEHFEWLAGTIIRLHPAAAFDQQSFDRTLEQRIANNESDLRILEAMRTVIVASQPPTD